VKAKERAKYDFMADEGYTWASEYMASLKALAEHFDATLSNWEIDWFAGSYSGATFRVPDDELGEQELQGKVEALGAYNKETLRGDGECILTDFTADEDAIDGLRQAYHQGERDMERLLQAAFQSWLKAAQADCEDYYTDERFGEMCEGNNYEFYEDGELA
jgi:hypothetical protein